MSRMGKCHQELTDGVGKCSVPMWRMGMDAGFCDEPAYGTQLADDRPAWARTPATDRAFAPGLACPGHGGPAAPTTEPRR